MEKTNLENEPTKMALETDNWKNLSYDEKLKLVHSTPADCSFIIGEGVNKRTIKAHKSILASASEVFHSMFNGNYKEAKASFNIPLPNVVNYVDFKVMLEYIYYEKKDSIKFLGVERLKHVAYLAHYYLLDSLLDACHSEIGIIVHVKKTNFHDFIQVFEYEKKMGRNITYMNINGSTYDFQIHKQNFPYTSEVVMTNTSIYDLEPSYFYDLLIIIASKVREATRFCLIENYAKVHGLKLDNCLFSDSEEDSKTSTNGKSLKEMFELIDFKKITTTEFTDGPAVSKVWDVTPEEKLASMLRTKKE